jgi:hypothetical protein
MRRGAWIPPQSDPGSRLFSMAYIGPRVAQGRYRDGTAVANPLQSPEIPSVFPFALGGSRWYDLAELVANKRCAVGCARSLQNAA